MVTVQVGDRRFENITGILFDKDGTLADSHGYLRELAQKRASLISEKIPEIGAALELAFGLVDGHLDPAGLMAVGSNQENAIAAAAFIAQTGRNWFDCLTIVQQVFAKADQDLGDRAAISPIYPGSREILRQCHAANLKLGILSMDSTKNVSMFVQMCQLQDYIQLEMGAEYGLKPDPDLFCLACKTLGTPPQQTLMVGDALGDIAMAKAAGAAGAVGITWGTVPPTHLEGADVAIAGLDALKII